jgi:hypothetical protein
MKRIKQMWNFVKDVTATEYSSDSDDHLDFESTDQASSI